jgi:hypothetical protein
MAQYLKHKWQKVLLIALGTLAGLILLAALLVNTILTPILSKKLKNAVLEASDSLYHINFTKAELHLFRGEVMLYDITLTADTLVYQQMKRRGKDPANLLQLRVKRLIISDAHPFKLYFKKKLEIGLITLNKPEVQMSKFAQKPDTAQKDERTLYQKLSKSLKLINVGAIALNEIKLIYTDYTGKKPAVSKFNNMSLKATDLLIDSATQTDTARTLYCRDITTQLFNFSGVTKTGLYTYSVKSVKLSTQTSRLTIAGIDLQPLPSKTFFAKSKEDRFLLHLDTLQLNDFDFQTYRKQQNINVRNVIATKGTFEVSSNPNPPVLTGDRLVTFPHWLIRQVKMGINADTVQVKNIKVTYKEFNKKVMKTGAIWFTNTTGSFYNITNKKYLLKKNNICTAKLSTYFMQKGKLSLVFKFNLNDASYNYSYQGHLGPMDAAAANPAVMPLGMVKIDSGSVKALDFNIHSTQKTSTGKVTLLYNDLKITMLGPGADKTYRKKPVLSLFANGLVVKNNNPDKAGMLPRSANLVFVRPANYPFFETVWLTLLSGIKSCAMGKAEPKEVKKPLTDKEKKKQEKELKKAQKKKEKEEKEHRKKLEEEAKKKKNDD